LEYCTPLNPTLAFDLTSTRYEAAGRLLGFKTFVVFVGSLVVICTVVGFLVSLLLPSYREIEFRRMQIAEKKAKAAVLARRGVNLE
jgi:hypothetical protein